MENKNLKDFIISLNLKKNPVEELRYDQKGNELRIYITPKDHNLTIEEFEFSHDGDLIDLDNIKTLGLLMARLRREREKDIFWSAILAQDKIKEPFELQDLTEEIKNHVPEIKTLIIFNQIGMSLAISDNRNLLENIHRAKAGRFINNHLEFMVHLADFKNEIKKILDLLRS